MHYTLGIHLGHHASCALVANGELVAAVQQERFSRRKHDGQYLLSDRLPIRQCLRAAGISIDAVDLIVSSFQAASAGGVGLSRPLIDPAFDLFDPYDRRHLVLSHHAAHAMCAFASSGFPDAAVIVCDLGGSTTSDGKDFYMPFGEWVAQLTSVSDSPFLMTECMSIYDANYSQLTLMAREFCIPHNVPEIFVQNAASLYDNVARSVFGAENAHGQLMALAALHTDPSDIPANALSKWNLVSISAEDVVTFRNNWQQQITVKKMVEQNAYLARITQEALEEVVIAYARRARKLSQSKQLALAGGVFLNILANTRIHGSGMFDRVYVPSAPHDAGIAVGCAFYGAFSGHGNGKSVFKVVTDRLGILYSDDEIEHELRDKRAFVDPAQLDISDLVERLKAGEIIARWSGRSEFGPRALGGRSLLASPLLSDTKDKLNAIKGRQVWRPVAPIVVRDRLHEFFLGSVESPYMSFAHYIRSEYLDELIALQHPDGSTRAQSLTESEDPELYQLLVEFGKCSGYPILVNTSLNGRNEPIVETVGEAIEFFLGDDRIDVLVVGNYVVRRRQGYDQREWIGKRVILAPDTIVSLVFPGGKVQAVMIRGRKSMQVSMETVAIIASLGKTTTMADTMAMATSVSADCGWQIYTALKREFLLVSE